MTLPPIPLNFLISEENFIFFFISVPYFQKIGKFRGNLQKNSWHARSWLCTCSPKNSPRQILACKTKHGVMENHDSSLPIYSHDGGQGLSGGQGGPNNFIRRPCRKNCVNQCRNFMHITGHYSGRLFLLFLVKMFNSNLKDGD